MSVRNRRSFLARFLVSALFLTLLFLTRELCPAQAVPESAKVRVQADQSNGPISPTWNYFGYDEPNYTYAPNGKKLLGELAALDAAPIYVRVHNLLTTGDGSASLKWGSTDVYSEDASGHAVYSWVILDQIFDTFHASGIKPLVEIGFMPKALSTHPEPYRHDFPRVGDIYTGWAYPPKDYQKWSDLVFQFVDHLRQRYGDAEVKTWLWEVWNEPDIGYWKGTREEYFKLYDFSVEAVLRALPEARIGGPDTTGPGNANAADFLRAFLEHCARGKNYANGKIGSRLDFVSFHPKGAPTWRGDHVQMGISHQLGAIEQGFRITASFPEWRQTPIILGESDPEGCAACSAEKNPQNLYPSQSTVTEQRTAGMLETKSGNINVRFLKSANWTEEAGFRAAESWLRLSTARQERIDVVQAQNDILAVGARRAIEGQTGRDHKSNLLFLGVDGLPRTGQAWVRQGVLTATVIVPPSTSDALNYLVAALKDRVHQAERTLIASESYPEPDQLAAMSARRDDAVKDPKRAVDGLPSERSS